MNNDQNNVGRAVKVPTYIGLKPLEGRYYAAECQRCGWVGSSEECTEDAQCTQIHNGRMCLGETEEIGTDHLLGIVQVLTKSAEQREVALAIPDGCPHMIVFDDAEVEQLMFAGTGARAAALRKWEAISTSWNAHLFVRIGRNSRDDGHPCAKIRQHQGEPVALPAYKLARTHNSHDWDQGHRDGWKDYADEIAKLGPLYTHPAPADPGEVERLRADLVTVKSERDAFGQNAIDLRAQLADLKRRHDGLHRDMATIAGRDVPKGCTVADYAAAAIADALSASAEPSSLEVSIPEGYCLMPKRLTAENGAKALLLGEFKLEVTRECPECLELDEPAEGCEICDGEGEYGQGHTIPWDKIKFIYSEAVKGLALKQSDQHPDEPMAEVVIGQDDMAAVDLLVDNIAVGTKLYARPEPRLVGLLRAENSLLRHDIASYLETMAKTCELLEVDTQAAKNAEGDPGEVLCRHAQWLRAQLDERGMLLRDAFVAMLKGGYSKPLRERIKAAMSPSASPSSSADRAAMTFVYAHPDGERHSVSVTRAEVAEGLESELFDKLVEKLCKCETVGETNVLDCCCDEVAEKFKLEVQP